MLKFLFSALLLAASLLGHAANESAANPTQKGLLVVYLGADDCRWCTWWESRLSGQEHKFKATPEFKRLQYRAVKNTWLADPYTERDFPAELKWVFDSMPAAERRPPRPSFLVFQDGKLQGKYIGSEGWEEKGFPSVKQLLANKD